MVLARWSLVCLWLLTAGGMVSAADTAAERFQTLVKQFDEEGGSKEFAPRFFSLAEEFPADPVAVDALVWILGNRRNQPEALQAIARLRARYLTSLAFERACQGVARVPSNKSEQLLRAALAESPHAQVRAAACLQLANLLEREAAIISQLKSNVGLADRMREYYGQDYGTHLLELDEAAVQTALEQVYEKMAADFSEVQSDDQQLGELASLALFRIRHLTVGRQAPEISGEDIGGKQFRLSDYRGQVVMISFWGHW